MRILQSSRHLPIGLAVVLALLLLATNSKSQTPTAGLLGQYQSRQRLARSMTEDMLTEIIDSQLQQMRDNHLTEMSLYDALTEMRGRVATIAKQQMPKVLGLLTQAISADGDERGRLVSFAQEEMRAILKRLIAERELIRARNQQAALIERIGEVIAAQKRASQHTSEANVADDRKVFAAEDAQTTTRMLFHEFVGTLDRVAGWPGELGSVASETKRILLTSKLTQRFDHTIAHIEQLELSQATVLQALILADLERIEIEIHKLEDPAWIGDDLVRAIKEMLDEQEQLKTETQEVSAATIFLLLDKQTLVQEKIGRLVGKVGLNERAIMLATRAETSAGGARLAIFEDDLPVAIDHQSDVIGSLVELLSELKLRDGMFDGPKSAQEFFELAQKMEQAKGQIVKVRRTTKSAMTRHERNPSDAKGAMRDAAGLLSHVELSDITPPPVSRRITTANRFLQDYSDGKVEATRESLEFADHLVGYAVGEVDQAHRDALRKAGAVKIGELNRAAESLSRAVGALRDESYLLRTGKERWGDGSFEEQLEVTTEIAEKVAEGTLELAPKAKPMLVKAIAEMHRAGTLANSDPVPADEALAQQIDLAAHSVHTASAQLRTEMIFTATELETVVVQELEQVIALEADLDELARMPQLPSAVVLAAKGDVVMQQYTAIGAALHAAAELRDSDPKQPGREVERARVLADIRRQELEELLEMIRKLLELSEQQQQAASELVEARDKVESGQKDQVDANQLAQAQQEFADSLTEIGETASEISQQSELANEPVQEATELAASLEPQVPPENQPQDSQPEDSQPEDSQPEDSQPEDSQPEDSQPEDSQPEDSQPQDSQPQDSQPQDSQPQDSQPQDSQPQDSQPQDSQPQDSQPQDSQPESSDSSPESQDDSSSEFSGSMTPEAAMSTAQMLSGTEASAMAESAMAAQMPENGEGVGATASGSEPFAEGNQPTPSSGNEPGQPRQPPMPSMGQGSEESTDPANNDPMAQPADSIHDSTFQDRAERSRPWTATLPDEIRDSMRSSSKQPLPKHYEDQLKAYFQSIEP